MLCHCLKTHDAPVLGPQFSGPCLIDIDGLRELRGVPRMRRTTQLLDLRSTKSVGPKNWIQTERGNLWKWTGAKLCGTITS